jgi:tyrosine-protein kinase
VTPTYSSDANDTPLGQSLARVLLRRWYAFLLPILIVPAGAFYLSLRQAARYEARAEVLIARPQLGSLLVGVSLPTEDPVRRAVTEREIANSRAVASRTAAALGLPAQHADRIARMVDFSVGRQADILSVSAKSTSARESVRIANAAASAYSALRRQLEARSIGQARRRTVRALRASRPGSDTALELRARLEQLAALDDLAGAESVVLEHSHSAERVAPRPVRTAEFGLGIGFVIGLALAYLAEALDRRVRSVAELGSLLRIPVIGELPAFSRLRRRRRVALPVFSDPRGAGAEAYRFLETNIALSPVGCGCRTMLVTSAQNGEGKTTTALNLALAAAESGKRVLLLELDFRRPCLAEVIGVPDAPGVAEVAWGAATLDEVGIALEVTHGPGASEAGAGLTIAVAGSEVPNPLQYLRSTPVQALVSEAGAQFDLVVLDVPSLFGFGDAMAASSLVDGVLLVVDFRHATRPRLADLLEATDQLPAAMIGVVVNRAPRRPSTPPQAYRSPTDDATPRISAVV